jgi:hypothetical protein
MLSCPAILRRLLFTRYSLVLRSCAAMFLCRLLPPFDALLSCDHAPASLHSMLSCPAILCSCAASCRPSMLSCPAILRRLLFTRYSPVLRSYAAMFLCRLLPPFDALLSCDPAPTSLHAMRCSPLMSCPAILHAAMLVFTLPRPADVPVPPPIDALLSCETARCYSPIPRPAGAPVLPMFIVLRPTDVTCDLPMLLSYRCAVLRTLCAASSSWPLSADGAPLLRPLRGLAAVFLPPLP